MRGREMFECAGELSGPVGICNRGGREGEGEPASDEKRRGRGHAEKGPPQTILYWLISCLKNFVISGLCKLKKNQMIIN
jgi:hypothetical protein